MSDKPKKEPKQERRPRFNSEELRELGEAAYQRKMVALSDEVIIESNSGWRKLTTDWSKWTDDERKDVLFGLSFHSGFKAKDIARLFNIKIDEVKAYNKIIDQGLVALKHKITTNQINFGLYTDQPVVKFHLGKQFAEQTDNPVHDDVVDVASSKTIVFNEIKNENTALREELEQAVNKAMEDGKVRPIR